MIKFYSTYSTLVCIVCIGLMVLCIFVPHKDEVFLFHFLSYSRLGFRVKVVFFV